MPLSRFGENDLYDTETSLKPSTLTLTEGGGALENDLLKSNIYHADDGGCVTAPLGLWCHLGQRMWQCCFEGAS